MDTASSVPNIMMEKEVEMEETEEMEVSIKDEERLSDSNSLESKLPDAQVGKPSGVGGKDYFAGGESAW